MTTSPFATPPPCCWPDCRERCSTTYPTLPLCKAHAETAHDAVAWYHFRPHVQRKGPRRLKGTIYYLLVDDLVKIGFATDMEGRMTQYPPSSILLAAHPGTTRDEQALHQKHKPHRARGREWYHPNADMLAVVEAIQPAITPMLLAEFLQTWTFATMGKPTTPPYPWLEESSNDLSGSSDTTAP